MGRAVGESVSADRRAKVRRQYEVWPYPHVPLLASVRTQDTWQLNLDYLWDRCGRGRPPATPRIWIAGCGTMQPYPFGLANRRAKILATDISECSLNIARRRCLWHGIYQVDYQVVDLADPATWPEGPFEMIECYGVLMNLPDPGQTLRELASRLEDRGVLRLMVYPHYGRTRVFQIQRVAQLLGLTQDNPRHPDLLRQVLLSLPKKHPLRYAFESYPDSSNDAGLVDAFLHAGDRGFTGHELSDLIESAGLEPAFWFHRPWGQPREMARALGLEGRGDSFVLHYLDLWQELRTNFIPCLVKRGAGVQPQSESYLHPLLAMGTPAPLPQKIRRIWHRVCGVTLPTRTTEEPIQLAGTELRALANGHADTRLRALAREQGLLLGGTPATNTPPATNGTFHRPWQQRPIRRTPQLEIGEQVANPFYHHLFEAWRSEQLPGLPDLTEQIERWRPHANQPGDHNGFGVTPFVTFERERDAVLEYLQRGPCADVTEDYGNLRYRDEERGRAQLRRYLVQFPGLPRRQRSNEEERELFILLRTADRLFLDADSL